MHSPLQQLISKPKTGLRLRQLLHLALLAVIGAGFAAKWLLCQNVPLSSDSVGPGLIALEMAKHGNILLTGYHMPASDSYLFTDVVPFHLLPQVLTGYNPVALKAVAFAIFGLAVLVFSLTVYLVTKNGTCSLIFAALATGISPLAFTTYATPANHVGTLFWAASLLFLALVVNPVKASGREPGKQSPLPALALVALTFLVAFSDSLIAAWFIGPYVLAYLLFCRPWPRWSAAVTGGLAVAGLAAYGLKTYAVRDYATREVQIADLSTVLTAKLQLLGQCLWTLLTQGQDTWVNLAGTITLLALLGLSLWLALRVKDRAARFLFAFFLFAFLITTAGFLATDYAGDISAKRFLTFSAFSGLALVAIAYGSSKTIKPLYVAVLVISLGLSLLLSGTALLGLSPYPDHDAKAVVQDLQSQNLTDGYGTYWASNLITYLSGETVIVRPIVFIDGGMTDYRWNSCDRWYTYARKDTFLLTNVTTLTPMDQSDVESTMYQLRAGGPEEHGDYLLYRLPQYKLSRVVTRDTPQGIEYSIE